MCVSAMCSCVLSISNVYNVFLCEVCYLDMCKYMKYVGSLNICNSYNHVFRVLHVFFFVFMLLLSSYINVYHVFLCEVWYFDMCVYIEYMKYMGSMIETLNEEIYDLYLNHKKQ
jgi:hypothetical protein